MLFDKITFKRFPTEEKDMPIPIIWRSARYHKPYFNLNTFLCLLVLKMPNTVSSGTINYTVFSKFSPFSLPPNYLFAAVHPPQILGELTE